MVVHHDAEGLPQNEGRPHDDVPPPRSLPVLPHDEATERGQRQLGHHPRKRPHLQHINNQNHQLYCQGAKVPGRNCVYLIRPEWDGHEVLVEEGGDEEGHSGRHQLGVRPLNDGNVEVTDGPTVDR
jgi:hypothetical protein